MNLTLASGANAVETHSIALKHWYLSANRNFAIQSNDTNNKTVWWLGTSNDTQISIYGNNFSALSGTRIKFDLWFYWDASIHMYRHILGFGTLN